MQAIDDPGRKGLLLFSILTSPILIGLTVYFLWFARRFQWVSLQWRIEMTAAIIVASTTLPWLFLSLRARMIRKLEPLVVDRHEKRLRFQELDLSLDQIVALQVCAVYRKLRLAYFHAFELNLVWVDPTDQSQQAIFYRRRTLMNVSGVSPRLGPFITELSQALSVPVLNHATREHWASEMRAARHRTGDEKGQSV